LWVVVYISDELEGVISFQPAQPKLRAPIKSITNYNAFTTGETNY